MEVRRIKRSGMELQMAPMIDCVFLLLIFFMVTAIMKVSPKIAVDLPQAQTRHEFPQKRYSLYIGIDGTMAVDDIIMANLGELDQFLSMHLAVIETLIIKADREVKHSFVISAMETARIAGIEKLALAIKDTGMPGIKLEDTE